MKVVTDTTQIQDDQICRICLSSNGDDRSQMIKPCKCSGTMLFVHASCLQNWIAISCRLSCEICSTMYRGRKVYKYGILASFVPYVRASWHRPRINFSLLVLFHLVERTIKETKRYYGRRRLGKPPTTSSNGHHSINFEYQLLVSILLRWLDYFSYPQTLILIILAFRDWSAWRRTQILFVLES